MDEDERDLPLDGEDSTFVCFHHGCHWRVGEEVKEGKATWEGADEGIRRQLDV